MAFLVMGYAIPYGDTTFVLSKENGEYFLIDPHSGKKCSSRNTFCPLTKVYCIVNNENVWANIQSENRVFMQNFDLSDTQAWRQLFNRSILAPQDLVHDLNLVYTNSLDCSNLKKMIEAKLMKKIACWRQPRKTVWNMKLKESLVNILMELEEDQCFDYHQKTYMDKLITELLSKNKVYFLCISKIHFFL